MQDQLHVYSENWYKYGDQTPSPRREMEKISAETYLEVNQHHIAQILCTKKSGRTGEAEEKGRFRREVNYFTSLPF